MTRLVSCGHIADVHHWMSNKKPTNRLRQVSNKSHRSRDSLICLSNCATVKRGLMRLRRVAKNADDPLSVALGRPAYTLASLGGVSSLFHISLLPPTTTVSVDPKFCRLLIYLCGVICGLKLVDFISSHQVLVAKMPAPAIKGKSLLYFAEDPCMSPRIC
jgi:hypothetical protein